MLCLLLFELDLTKTCVYRFNCEKWNAENSMNILSLVIVGKASNLFYRKVTLVLVLVQKLYLVDLIVTN
jgi:hypothetical protein